jgi:hypothetical protein
MKLLFKEENHKYLSDDAVTWTSVTSLISKVKQPFDSDAIALKQSKKKGTVWYGLKPSEIQKIWENESNRAKELGNWYHKMRENLLIDYATINGLTVYKPIFTEDGDKIAPSQELTEGIYPEHFVYLQSAKVCGQTDKVEVKDGYVNITDYKSNKKIDMNSYVNYEGVSKKLLKPLHHLEDCHFIHYSLQMSIYMYIILKHNPSLKPGKLIIEHVEFEIESENEYGYPIYKKDDYGFVIKNTNIIECKYLHSDVLKLIKELV